MSVSVLVSFREMRLCGVGAVRCATASDEMKYVRISKLTRIEATCE